MARKTAYEKTYISIQEEKDNNKDTKKRVWQYLFENKPEKFSATELGKILEVSRYKATYALNKLMEGKPIIERNIEYRVYKIDTSYCIFTKKQYQEYKAKQKNNNSIEDLIGDEAVRLSSSPNIWAADKAEDLRAEVIFYPINKHTKHFSKVKTSLMKLFEEYIIAILEGDKEGQSGLYIILKPHKDSNKIKEDVQKLYSQSAIYREKDIQK